MDQHPSAGARRARLLAFSATLGALFVAAINQTLVSTALPSIVADLGGFTQYSWVFTAYMLTSTVSAPVWGKLSDLYGRRVFLLIGMSIFIGASLAGGLAQSMQQLILYRGIQGFGAGMIMACAFTVIGDLFSPLERGRYQGLMAGVFGLASILGPAVGGALSDHLSWRFAFFLNVPVGLATIPFIAFYVPGATHAVRRVVDYLGAVTLAGFATPLLLAFVWGGDRYAWDSPQIVALFGAGAASLCLFLFVEQRAADPVIPLQLFRNGPYVAVAVTAVLTGMGLFGATVYMPLFVQGVIGRSATSSGTVTAPLMIGMVIASAITGSVMARTGRYKVTSVIGTGLMVIGLGLLAMMTRQTAWATAALLMVLLGIGTGMVMPALTVIAQNAVEPRLLGVATSNVQFYRQFGGTLGVAVLGTLVNSRLRSAVSEEVTNEVPPDLREQLADPQILVNPAALAHLETAFATIPNGPALLADVLESLRRSLADGITLGFLIGSLATSIAVVAVLLMRELPLRDRPALPEPNEVQTI